MDATKPKRPFISRHIRDGILARDGHQCLACGKPETLVLDHKIPWSKGGPSIESNLQTLCKRCNWLKNDLPLTIEQLREHPQFEIYVDERAEKQKLYEEKCAEFGRKAQELYKKDPKSIQIKRRPYRRR